MEISTSGSSGGGGGGGSGSANLLESADPEVIRGLIQSIFTDNKCYDLMQNSSKVSEDKLIHLLLAFSQ